MGYLHFEIIAESTEHTFSARPRDLSTSCHLLYFALCDTSLDLLANHCSIESRLVFLVPLPSKLGLLIASYGVNK